MPLIKTPAIVLSTRDLGEADKLVTFFTHRSGKIAGTARGARRIKSRFGGSLEPFTHCQIILFQKTPDSLYRIQQADIIQSFRELREDLEHILWASRVTALTSAMVPEGEANPMLFNVLLQTLISLRGPDSELATRLFEIRLVRYTGYQPRLEVEACLGCRRPLDSKTIFFSPGHGGIICKSCSSREGPQSQPVTRGTIAFFQQVLRMPSRLASRLKATPVIKDELKDLLEVYFDHLLGRSSNVR
ncbi:MAG: DNA repair protein RecO [Nitrospira sp.]|nr:DNA repair protein RecO [Nitrospira sp.]